MPEPTFTHGAVALPPILPSEVEDPDELSVFLKGRGTLAVVPPVMDAAVMLINPKTAYNVGSVIRACSIFDVPWLRWSGNRVTKAQRNFSGSAKPRLPREERMKDYLGVDWKEDQKALDDFIAEGLTPVCVEVREAAEMLDEFVHPERAVYVFGPEDGTVPKGTLHVCHRFVRIRTANRTPLNLAAAVNVVLHDRYVKGLR